ncbi:collagen-like protein [Dyadobacter pollutisoli]|uniref:Collagen-like protein n=1 Tax=Dyadobacter pollutisoli TaxID=2910158 RepID=A0A9E8NB79_9BACT|nr:collagen-like protein [Dyadobacter pollutisoli]WAC11826.1 collagen-like protein [Dyadobacter pollutisoli]
MLKKLMMMAFVGLVLVSMGCDGDKGDVGPAGPAGPKGDPGVNGKDGASDTVGVGGSVLVFMDTISTDANGRFTLSDTTFFKGMSKEEVASIEKGSVQVFIKSRGVYFPLPGPVLFADEVIDYIYYYGVDGLELFFEFFTATPAPKNKKRKLEELRVVIIPALNAGRLANINLKDYEQTVKALGITEANIKKIYQKK